MHMDMPARDVTQAGSTRQRRAETESAPLRSAHAVLPSRHGPSLPQHLKRGGQHHHGDPHTSDLAEHGEDAEREERAVTGDDERGVHSGGYSRSSAALAEPSEAARVLLFQLV